jgi:hypothetical protein
LDPLTPKLSAKNRLILVPMLSVYDDMATAAPAAVVPANSSRE